ncbi:hypothetical protein CBL_06148 [Carabus blaptoides fortunei]
MGDRRHPVEWFLEVCRKPSEQGAQCVLVLSDPAGLASSRPGAPAAGVQVSDVALPLSRISNCLRWMFLRIPGDRYVRKRLSDVAVPMAACDKDVIDGDGGDP